MIDMHSHILPGIDDGATDMDEAVAMARIAVADGIRTVIATPHTWNPMYHAEISDRDSALTALRQRLAQDQIPLEIQPGFECHIIEDVVEVVKADLRSYALNGGKTVLLEWPDDMPLTLLKPVLFNAAIAGIGLILAHAERHAEVVAKPMALAGLVDAGLKVQLSASSLTRPFSWRTKRAAKQLLREGLVHNIATDAHDADSRPPCLAAAIDAAKKLIGPPAEKLAE